MDKAYDVGLFDAHCHPTDILDSIARIAGMKAKVLTVMSTRSQDQHLVAAAAEKYPINDKDELESGNPKARYVVPAFGWHPWFSHQMYFDKDPRDIGYQKENIDAIEHYKSVLTPTCDDEAFLKDLMPPMSFSNYLKETEERLIQFPLALVGEIGLDRGCRLPIGPDPMTGDGSRQKHRENYTAGSREGRPLSPYKINLEHQKRILKEQLQLAAKLSRPVSVHSVQAHGVVFEVLQSLWKDHLRPSKRSMRKKHDAENALDYDDEDTQAEPKEPAPYPPRICMHSYSGPKDTLRLFLDPKVPADVFFSFSECINFGGPASSKANDVIKAVPEDRILIESDMNCAGVEMDRSLRDILQRICKIRDWDLVEGARICRRNWERFIFGD